MMFLRPVYTRLLKKSVRAFGAGALIVLFGLSAWKAGKEALSRGYLESAYFELERSAAPGPLAQQEQWMRAMQYLTDSLRYAPDNAWTLEEMGAHNLHRQRGRADGKIPMAGISGANVNFQTNAATSIAGGLDQPLGVALPKHAREDYIGGVTRGRMSTSKSRSLPSVSSPFATEPNTRKLLAPWRAAMANNSSQARVPTLRQLSGN